MNPHPPSEESSLFGEPDQAAPGNVLTPSTSLRLVAPPPQRDGAMPLHEYVASHHVPIPARIELFEQLLMAVSVAHSQARLHGDWAFSRILITPEGELRIAEASAKSRMIGAIGAEFASPEQLSGQRITTASDFYSAGVIFYWLLSGQHPHANALGDVATLAEAAIHRDPEPPSVRIERLMNSISRTDFDDLSLLTESAEEDPDRIARMIEGELDAIALKLLKRNPAERYQSAGEVLADFRYRREERPVSAMPQTTSYRLNKWILRYPVLASFFLVASVGLVLGVLGTFWQTFEARRERDQTQARLKDARRLARTVAGPLSDALEALPRSVEAQQALTAPAVARLDQLLKLDPGDNQVRMDLAEASLRMAKAFGSPAAGGMRDPERAIASFERAFRLANAEANDLKKDKTAVELVARVRCAQGGFYLDSKDVVRARAESREAVSLFEKLIRFHVSDLRLLENTSACYGSLARSWAGDEGNPTEEGAALKRAYELDGFLTRLAPRESRYRQALAVSTVRMADWLDRNTIPGATRLYEEGLRTLDTSGSLDPAMSNLKAELLHRLGQQARAAGNLDLAVERFEAALQTRDAIAAKIGDRRELFARAASIYEIAEIDEQRGRLQPALTQWLRVAAVLRPLSVGGGASASYGEVLCRAAMIQAKLEQRDDALRSALMGVEQLRVSARFMDGRPEDLQRAGAVLLQGRPEELWQPWLALRYVQRAAELTAYQDPAILKTLAEAYIECNLGLAAMRASNRALDLIPANAKGSQAQLRAVLERYAVSPPEPKFRPKSVDEDSSDPDTEKSTETPNDNA